MTGLTQGDLVAAAERAGEALTVVELRGFVETALLVLAGLQAPTMPLAPAAARARRAYVDYVFDGPPGPTGPRFIETEDPDGRSVGVGTWIDRGDGTWALRVPGPDR